MKNRHDEVVAEDHWVGDDNHGGEAELHEAGDQLVEEGDDEEKGEDPAREKYDPCLDLLVAELGGQGEGKDGEGDDDWRYIRLKACHLWTHKMTSQTYRVSQKNVPIEQNHNQNWVLWG